ncbi:hypothetical protein I6E17_03565 [Fusobacterium perfoetens]|uniref:hypothetical protein n=1 Tax=Fusobacterium perfoetens TaxID=852 RepID=UPI001F15A133|nr:hypothetical protein [Fusobacterium perfoetens]MCF2625258.1 hypothetical protein [Fusobacterium perfoetens]
MGSKYILNIIKNFLPELLKKHLSDDGKVNEIMADLEKQRLNAFSGLIERGGILHLFYVYSILIINQHIIVPYFSAFTGKAIYVQPIPEELTYLVMALGATILGKKYMDKKIDK